MTDIDRRALGRLGAGAFIAMMAGRAGEAAAASAIAPAPASVADDPLAHLDPELVPAARQVIAQSEGAEWTSAALARIRAGTPPAPPPLPDVPVQELRVPVGPGQPPVRIFVINARPGTQRPGILHMHGGGYILGSAALEVAYEQALARELDCVIVTVDYRLAPETPYAGSVEDNHAALRWMHGHARALGLDPARIVAMGESAGGGHAARLAITARDRGEVPLAGQVLVYPMLDDRTGSTVHLPPFIGAFGWTAQANRFGWASFLGMAPGGPDVPAAGVPARVADLSGLPPAFVAVGGVDLFVREDIDYARRLTEAGVPTDLLVVPGAFHAFDRVAPEAKVSRRFTAAKMDALRRFFAA